ncbi:hypothetical protein OBBRIDRAFT_176216 [Obba rivulosa]|uniref:Uncharacterized protein n=1 Tax=Obba rivulosa TaxID=1052685 RepID=A0A8E2DGI2_9APHY|nr:hypothetical protein OBBRIDRAFT_176216 [Obba rivulosa]
MLRLEKKREKPSNNFLTRLKLSKSNRAAVVSGVKITIQTADVVANLTPISIFQAATGAASKIISCCDAMKDNKKQSRELTNLTRDVLVSLLATDNSLHKQESNVRFMTEMIALGDTLSSIEKEIFLIAKSSRLKGFINVASNAEKIARASDKLKNTFHVIQLYVAHRTELASVTKEVSHIVSQVHEIGRNMATAQAQGSLTRSN